MFSPPIRSKNNVMDAHFFMVMVILALITSSLAFKEWYSISYANSLLQINESIFWISNLFLSLLAFSIRSIQDIYRVSP